MKRLLLIVAVALLAASTVQAQPTKRRTDSATAARRGNQKTASDRAALMFPTSDVMPEDQVWRRDIYRQLDLTLDKNAPLYYPVEPIGNQVNLFTYLFRLFLTGRVSAYEYKIDGNEHFEEKDKVTDIKDVLDRYYIYYEEDGNKLTVADNDVPSAMVKRYYIKESNYLDVRTGTTHAKVVAICPILVESDDFGTGESKPLFWMKYDDLAPYLSRLPVMASNLNNVTNMTADDFFAMNRYDGKIYKVSNMQGQTLHDYCKTDTALTKEQKRIEKQLSDFEEGLWSVQELNDSTDSVDVADADKKSAKRSARSSKSKEAAVDKGSTSRRSSSSSSKRSKSSGSKNSAPTVSARRTRR